jgi:hypothetical protein
MKLLRKKYLTSLKGFTRSGLPSMDLIRNSSVAYLILIEFFNFSQKFKNFWLELIFSFTFHEGPPTPDLVFEALPAQQGIGQDLPLFHPRLIQRVDLLELSA